MNLLILANRNYDHKFFWRKLNNYIADRAVLIDTTAHDVSNGAIARHFLLCGETVSIRGYSATGSVSIALWHTSRTTHTHWAILSILELSVCVCAEAVVTTDRRYMSRELFRAEVPVSVSSRHSAPNGSGVAAISLSAALTLSPAATLTFTLADLRDRLFHLSFELTSADYPAVRDAQALRVDFAAFPHRFAELLRKPAAEPDSFSAFLVLPENPADGAPHFSIFERNNFKNLKHLELFLTISTDLVVRRAIADRAKRAESQAAAEEAIATQARADREEALKALQQAEERECGLRNEVAELARQNAEEAAANAGLRREVDAAVALRHRVTELESTLQEREKNIAELRGRLESSDGLRQELDEAREAFKTEVAAREKQVKDTSVLQLEIAEADQKIRDAVSEIEKGNTIIGRLEENLKDSRQKVRVSSAVIERQETAVLMHERKIAELERDLRKAQDGLEMMTLERDGLSARLKAAKEKIEENDVLQATNQQVIAYLNRQLNRRAMARRAQDPSQARPSSYEYDSSTTTS